MLLPEEEFFTSLDSLVKNRRILCLLRCADKISVQGGKRLCRVTVIISDDISQGETPGVQHAIGSSGREKNNNHHKRKNHGEFVVSAAFTTGLGGTYSDVQFP